MAAINLDACETLLRSDADAQAGPTKRFVSRCKMKDPTNGGSVHEQRKPNHGAFRLP
jgi:hypothetical protein